MQRYKNTLLRWWGGVWKSFAMGAALVAVFLLVGPSETQAYPQQGCKLNSGVSCIVIQGGSTNFTDQTKPLNPNSPLACTGAPICGRSPNLPYYERGHRVPNVGSAIDMRTGYVVRYKGDGSFDRLVCSIQYLCGSDSPAATAAAAAALKAEAGGTDQGQAADRPEATEPIGWLDSVTCDAGAKGWVYDPNNVEAPVTIHFYMDGKAGAGGTLITSGVTSESRDDVNTLFNISGNHGFVIKLPDSVRDGKQHTLYAYGIDTNGGTNLILGGGGKTFNCTGTTGTASTNPTAVTVSDKTLPVGWFDSANCFQFTGWAFDQDNPTASLTVHFYVDVQPGQTGAKVFGDIVTNVVRDDVNKLYGITGTHGFVYRFASAAGNPMADGKEHKVYAYAINTNGGENPLLGGSPKVVKCAGTGAGPNSGEGGGRSSRHNYMSKCNGNGDYDAKEDPAISAEMGPDGKIIITITALPGQTLVFAGPDGQPITLGPGGTYTFTQDPTKPFSGTITVGTHVYYIDTDGLTGKGDTTSILIPVPCIRIGYNDVLGGKCGEDATDGTCAKELAAFINIDGIQNSGLHVDDATTNADGPDEFKVQYIIKGGPSDTGGWKEYDWRKCGQYSDRCITLKGKGVICARTKLLGGSGNHFSLTTCKKFDAETGDDGLDDYDPL